MRAWLRGERGEMSLIEMLVAITIFGGVLGATLFTFQTFDTLSRRNVRPRRVAGFGAHVGRPARARTCATSRARRSRSRRRSTRPSPYDLIFQTVDPIGPNTGANAANIKRVRWCLDTSDPANEKLYLQEQKWTTQATPAAAVERQLPRRAAGPRRRSSCRT